MRLGGQRVTYQVAIGCRPQPPATARNCPMGSPTVNLCSESGSWESGIWESGISGSGIWESGHLGIWQLEAWETESLFSMSGLLDSRGNPTLKFKSKSQNGENPNLKFKSKSQNGEFWMLIGDDDW